MKSVFIEHNQIKDNKFGVKSENSKATISSNNFINNGIQAFSSSLSMFIPLYFRQHWTKNYWDNWKIRIPKPIMGFWILVFFIVTIPKIIGPFPTIQFDWHPAQEPYDIGV